MEMDVTPWVGVGLHVTIGIVADLSHDTQQDGRQLRTAYGVSDAMHGALAEAGYTRDEIGRAVAKAAPDVLEVQFGQLDAYQNQPESEHLRETELFMAASFDMDMPDGLEVPVSFVTGMRTRAEDSVDVFMAVMHEQEVDTYIKERSRVPGLPM